MIFSSLDARECPFTYPAAIGKALNWLKEHDLARMEPGIYEIEGKDLFVNIQDITTKPVQECRPERHHQYLDIQYIVSGREQMGFVPDNGREENCTDVEGRDVVFYQNLQEESFVTVPAGSYCIFFSNDIHRPGCAAGEAAAVRKAVVKINQKLLEQRSNTIHEERQEVYKMSDFSLEGKTALVTGASYGIGLAIATALAKAGARIVFNNINQESVDTGLEAYAKAGITARGYVCDVTDEEAVQKMVAQIESEVGVIDILVNNAGIIKRIPMLEMSARDFRQVIDVDLNAPFIVAKAVIPGMIKKGGGKIINICSMMSELGRETVSAYAAAKGGLKMLTKNIASEYGQYNIQCNGIGPGYIATPQTAPLRETQPDGSKHPFDQFILAKTPANRWGEASDLGGPAVFLASSASDFVNGHILYVDGGILAYIGKQP